MDPLTIGAAYIAAQAAVKGIKEAIKLGKDIGEIAYDVNKFFHSQATIDKAAREKSEQLREAAKDPKQKQSYYELTAHAMEIAIKQEEMARHEKEIRDALIWSGNGHIYKKMCEERSKMVREMEQIEATEKIMRSRQAQLDAVRKEEMRDIYICIVVVLTFGFIFYMVVDWMIAEGMVLTTSGKLGKR